ncbi:LAFE_0B10286g1_1 [Lachancea fermentati]|uniref:ER membrane protein complex subunit 2 n=1 Tax=Lachancea fermentati TaxID=4955 RepID=A0A1G4M8N2_LACFM|nr:LAFE_0B10286g1_1 [Lachancea fermentati]
MDPVKERFLTIEKTKYYTIASPAEVSSLYGQLKTYLGSGDQALTELEYMSLMRMLFDLTVYIGKDVEAEALYKTFADRLGENSPHLHVMKATLIQINDKDAAAENYLTTLLKDSLEYDTDALDYLLVSKKLLSIRRNSLTKEKFIRQVLDLVDKFPLDAELWWFLAQEYFGLGQFEQASYCLEEVLCIHPFNYVAFGQLGQVLYYKALRDKKTNKTATLEASLNNFLRSVELSETFLKGWSFIANISKELGKKELLELAKGKLMEIQKSDSQVDSATAKLILEKL